MKRTYSPRTLEHDAHHMHNLSTPNTALIFQRKIKISSRSNRTYMQSKTMDNTHQKRTIIKKIKKLGF